MENIPADYWLILCIIDYWLAPFTQNHISILTLQSVSTGGLAPGISLEKKIANVDTLNVRVSMPSRAYTSFLLKLLCQSLSYNKWRVNALSGLYLISTLSITLIYSIITCVNALSGLYLISTTLVRDTWVMDLRECQCPLGLIPHFYWTSLHRRQKVLLCQCPLGLIPHFYKHLLEKPEGIEKGVNALSGLYLISTVPIQKPRFYAVSRACFCRYLSEYSDNSRFSCMLTFWTYLMRCTYPWHWIKYSTNYNRCHPIFSLSW